MEQIIKAFVGVIFILIVTFTGVGIITASIDASNAEQCASDVAKLVEASDFSESIIAEIEDRFENGDSTYDITINAVDTDNDGKKDLAEVVVSYDYSIKILNVSKVKHYAKVYAR